MESSFFNLRHMPSVRKVDVRKYWGHLFQAVLQQIKSLQGFSLEYQWRYVIKMKCALFMKVDALAKVVSPAVHHNFQITQMEVEQMMLWKRCHLI